MSCRNNRFDVQTDISQKDKVLFLLVAACCLITENSKWAFFYVSDKNSVSENFEMEKKKINL